MSSSSGSASTQTGNTCLPHLDDWLVKAKSLEKCQEHVQIVMQILHTFGFSNNHNKSSLLPDQEKVFLGAMLNTDRTGKPSPEESRGYSEANSPLPEGAVSDGEDGDETDGDASIMYSSNTTGEPPH